MTGCPDDPISSVSPHFHVVRGDGHLQDFVIIVNPDEPLHTVGVEFNLVEFALDVLNCNFVTSKQLNFGVGRQMLAGHQDSKVRRPTTKLIIFGYATGSEISPDQQFTVGEKIVIQNDG